MNDAPRLRLRFRGLLLLIGLLAGPAVAESRPKVTFVKPRHLATALGETTIQVFLALPDGAEHDRVELLIDGKPYRTLSGPPWTVQWNAGDGSRGHSLQAILHLKDGRQARTAIRTSPLMVNQFEAVDLVNLYLVVRNSSGQYVTDLGQDDFKIFENDQLQRIERFTTTHKPLRVGIVLDSSLSMSKGERLEKAKAAALDFLDILEPGDEGIVVGFNDRVLVTQELTGDKELLADAIREAKARGGTALYDAVWKGARLLEGFDGRRVMVLLSDGRDESANGFEPGSLHTLEEALDQALRSEVMIFPIGLGRNLDKEYVRRWDNLSGLSNVDTSTSLASVLENLADSTGGRAVTSSGAGKLRKAFSEIAEDLRNQYSIAYVSTNATRDGKWRPIRVQTPGRTLEVITRKGYYAPKDKASKRIGKLRR